MKKGISDKNMAAFWKAVVIGLIVGVLIGMALQSFSSTITGNVAFDTTLDAPSALESQDIEIGIAAGVDAWGNPRTVRVHYPLSFFDEDPERFNDFINYMQIRFDPVAFEAQQVSSFEGSGEQPLPSVESSDTQFADAGERVDVPL